MSRALHSTLARTWWAALVMSVGIGAVAPGSALAQDPVPAQVPRPGNDPPPTVPPDPRGAQLVDINFVDADLYALLQYFGRATKMNFVLGETRELEGKKVTIIANKKVSPAAAYEAFMSAMEVHGMTIVKTGDVYKVIKAPDAQKKPGKPGEGGDIRLTDQYITQIIPFENISVKDVREIVDNLVSPDAKVLAYAPANTLILTDTGYNIRRIYDIVSQLDVSAPKSSLEIYQIVYAEASEIKSLIEELYGTAEEETPEESPVAARRRRRRARAQDDSNAQEGVTAGKESNYISKVISDERTNALIAIANEQGHKAILDLIGKVDIDVDPTSRSQIYVYRLEHAKAADVASVLQELANGGSSSGEDASAVDARLAARAARQAANAPADGAGDDKADKGAIAAFESGTRIAPDENTNSLVIIASKDDYLVVEGVIRELDTQRKQVFVDAVLLELSSSDSLDLNLAYHAPYANPDGTVGVFGGQFGTNSLGFTPDLLTGLAFGIFGQTVDVPIVDTGTGTSSTLSVPAFGIALQALKTAQMVNIVSTPSLLALDNEEAKIVVGRKIPFPTSNALNSLGQPVISFQREDVAITLELTPRVNSENQVTLELKVEVQEIEQGQQSSAAANGGFITSKREIETTVLVGDNQTVVLGGLVSATESESENKIPVLGDLPLIGALFRGRNTNNRRTNLLVFLTPHIIEDDNDFAEIMRVKEAQRGEFMRRFFGKSQSEQFEEIRRLLQYSMNNVDRPSVYRGPTTIASTEELAGTPISAASREELRSELERGIKQQPGSRAGTLPVGEVDVVFPAPPPAEEAAPAPPPEPAPPADEGAPPDDDGGGSLDDEPEADEAPPEIEVRATSPTE